MSGLYVALGDSMSIDDYAGGPGRGAASLLMSNLDVEFPDWVGRDLTTAWPGIEALILARDGATSCDVLHKQVETLDRIPAQPSLVTITCGGNDLLTCYGDVAGASVAVDRVEANLANILARLRELSGPGMKLMVTTVYDPSDGRGTLDGISELPPWSEGLAVLARLNTTIRRVATDHAAILADVHAHFIGHGVSQGDPSQVLAHPDNVDLWYCGAVEPNAFGASAIRACWWEALRIGS